MAAFNYMIILGIGTRGLLWSHLDFLLEVRGAIDFVRPFHAASLIMTVATATFAFGLLLRRGPALLEGRPALQTGGYLFCVLAAWFFGLPFGDFLAETWERGHKMASEAGDTGYGWFYTEDSGMGHWPMSPGHVLYE